MLPNPIPYSESESLLLQQRFRFLVSFFLITFSSSSDFSLNCVKDFFMGLGFVPPFLAARKSAFSVPFFLETTTIVRIVCRACAPMLIARSQSFSVHAFWDCGQYQVATYLFYCSAKVSCHKKQQTFRILPGHTICCTMVSCCKMRWSYRIFPGHIRAQ
jgi:hypothetical protein